MADEENIIEAKGDRVKSVDLMSLEKSMFQGTVLVIIIIFFLSLEDLNVGLPASQILIQLMKAGISGAMGGAFYCFLNQVCYQDKWKNIFINFLSVIAYFIWIWLVPESGIIWTM